MGALEYARISII